MGKEPSARLERFAERLEEDLGDNLLSLVLYGPAARNQKIGGRVLVRLLLIVRDASPNALRPVESDIAEWVKKGQPPPLIFAEPEWRGSTDVFPIEIEEMRDAHRLLRGNDPFEGIETTRDDLRRELEREVRGKLLHLRTEYAAAAPNGRALSRLLTESADAFFVIFRALLRLVGRAPPTDPAEQVNAMADVTGIDPRVFDWVVGALSGETVRALKPFDPIAASYVEAVERLAQFVDEA